MQSFPPPLKLPLQRPQSPHCCCRHRRYYQCYWSPVVVPQQQSETPERCNLKLLLQQQSKHHYVRVTRDSSCNNSLTNRGRLGNKPSGVGALTRRRRWLVALRKTDCEIAVGPRIAAMRSGGTLCCIVRNAPSLAGTSIVFINHCT